MNSLGNPSSTNLIIALSLTTLFLAVSIAIISVMIGLVIYVLRAYKRQQVQLQNVKFRLRQIPGLGEEEDEFDEKSVNINTVQNSCYSPMK